MIKINLLPPGIFEGRIIKQLIALFSVLLVVVIVACVAYTMRINRLTEAKKLQADEAQLLSQEALRYQGESEALRASLAPIDARRKFFEDVWAYNVAYPKIYSELARFTYAKVNYSSVSASSGGLTIQAHAPSLSDLGRYLLNMYRATHLLSSVQISSGAVPGYSSGGQAQQTGGMGSGIGMTGMAMAQEPAQSGISFTVTCSLVAPPAAPSPPGTAAAAEQATPGAAPQADTAGADSSGPVEMK